MTAIERRGGAERQPDPVQRDRVVAPQLFEAADRRPAAHVVLRMRLEPSDGRTAGKELGDVRLPNADAGAESAAAGTVSAAAGTVSAACRFTSRDHASRLHSRGPSSQARFGMSAPPTTFSHVPDGT